jgi:hypothetical protein
LRIKQISWMRFRPCGATDNIALFLPFSCNGDQRLLTPKLARDLVLGHSRGTMRLVGWEHQPATSRFSTGLGSDGDDAVASSGTLHLRGRAGFVGRADDDFGRADEPAGPLAKDASGASSSRSDLASRRSGVSSPSVNQPYTSATSRCASAPASSATSTEAQAPELERLAVDHEPLRWPDGRMLGFGTAIDVSEWSSSPRSRCSSAPTNARPLSGHRRMHRQALVTLRRSGHSNRKLQPGGPDSRTSAHPPLLAAPRCRGESPRCLLLVSLRRRGSNPAAPPPSR